MNGVVVNDADFLEFARRIKRRTGLDLLSYKQSQLQRRLDSTRDKLGFKSFVEWSQVIEKSPESVKAFLDRVTINVTEFYRNPQQWELLIRDIAPTIATKRIKCWSAACSTGEEPYTMVLSLSDAFALQNIDVLATDLDEKVLGQAKDGRYSGLSVKNVPPDKLTKFFGHEQGQYRITDRVKERVRFKQLDLLSGAFQTGFDLIVCRNVMIYFTESAKEQLIQKFTDALKPGGYLFVGGTEQILNPGKFGLQSAKMFVYRKV